MANEFSGLSERAEYYRELAAEIRARAASMTTAAARQALAMAADGYELLARYTQSLEATRQILKRWPGE